MNSKKQIELSPELLAQKERLDVFSTYLVNFNMFLAVILTFLYLYLKSRTTTGNKDIYLWPICFYLLLAINFFVNKEFLLNLVSFTAEDTAYNCFIKLMSFEVAFITTYIVLFKCLFLLGERAENRATIKQLVKCYEDRKKQQQEKEKEEENKKRRKS